MYNSRSLVWFNISLLLFNLSVVAGLLALLVPRFRSSGRVIALGGIKLGGVLLVTALLVQFADYALVHTLPPPPLAGSRGPVVQVSEIVGPRQGVDTVVPVVMAAMIRSLLLLSVATIWGAFIGLGAAYLVQLKRYGAGLLAMLAVLVWVTPTFLLAAFAQEFQAQIFNVTNLALSGGYGTASAGQAFWAGVVIGLRPAAYSYRQARTVLESQAEQDHVRTAIANGLPWATVVLKHIFRPAAASLVGVWLNSFRVMLGSLPLVEFFFGYPGFGQQLILSLGVSYPNQVGVFRPDLAIGFVVALALVILSLEAVAELARMRLDPRLAEGELAPA